MSLMSCMSGYHFNASGSGCEPLCKAPLTWSGWNCVCNAGGRFGGVTCDCLGVSMRRVHVMCRAWLWRVGQWDVCA
jgi:hypothetical protein